MTTVLWKRDETAGGGETLKCSGGQFRGGLLLLLVCSARTPSNVVVGGVVLLRVYIRTETHVR